MFEKKVFKKKKFSDILEDIYEDNEKKKRTIEDLIDKLAPMVTDQKTAITVVPLIKEYMELGVKNSDNLIKMAGIVQRALAKEGGEGTMEMEISKNELAQLLENTKDITLGEEPPVIPINKAAD